jgi:protein-S-isoprenylcysteine O-methyltransferase Ste14
MIFRTLPAVLIGILVGIYWLRVAHLARKIRRRVGHTANVLPPGKLGLITRMVWLPVVCLWIAIPISTIFLRDPPRILAPLIDVPVLAWGAFAVAVAAFVLTLICWKKMGKSWRMGIDPEEKTSLIVPGPFAYLRHPIYALSSVLMLATAAADPAPLMLGVAAVHLVLLQIEARREESYLTKIHGDLYLEYRARTGRFLPRMKHCRVWMATYVA